MAKFIKIYPENPNEREIQKVVECLRDGGVIIYPTDTVYGLGCDITHSKALERIAHLKGVKLDKANFSFVCEDLSNLSDYVKQIDKTVRSKIRVEAYTEQAKVAPIAHFLTNI